MLNGAADSDNENFIHFFKCDAITENYPSAIRTPMIISFSAFMNANEHNHSLFNNLFKSLHIRSQLLYLITIENLSDKSGHGIEIIFHKYCTS